MSRNQQQAVWDVAGKQNKQYNQDAQTSFAQAEGDLNNYASAVGKFSAANPYVQGGQVETAENQEMADTAAAGTQAAGQALQGSAVRGGQNPGAAIAATTDIAAVNQRQLAGEEAAASERRAAAGTGYGEAALKGTGQIEDMQAALADEQGKLAAGALSTQGGVSATPSLTDTFGTDLAYEGTIGAGQQAAESAPKCWLTSACVAYVGLPDDCHELMVLRDFRDDYMLRAIDGTQMIEEYYHFAPRIVEEIEASEDRWRFYRLILHTVRRAVSLISRNENQEALRNYKRCYQFLRRKVLHEVR